MVRLLSLTWTYWMVRLTFLSEKKLRSKLFNVSKALQNRDTHLNQREIHKIKFMNDRSNKSTPNNSDEPTIRTYTVLYFPRKTETLHLSPLQTPPPLSPHLNTPRLQETSRNHHRQVEL